MPNLDLHNLITSKKEEGFKLITDSRKILDKARAEKRNLTDEEKAKHATMMKDALDIKGDAERMLLQMKAEEEFALPDKRKVSPNSPDATDETDKGEKFRHAFRNYLTQKPGGEEEMRALQLDSNIGGGYTLPQKMNERILTKKKDLLFMRQICDVLPPLTDSDSLGTPTLENDPADADWTSEVGDINEDSTMSFGKRELKPNLLTKYILLSTRAINKMPNLENFVADRLAYKTAVPEENQFLNGNGVEKPLGLFFASDNGISTGRDVVSNNRPTEFTMKGLKAIKWKVKAGYQNNASWLMNKDAVAKVDDLVDGSGRYEWQPSTQLNAPDVLLGKPLHISEYAPNTFTANQYFAMYGDFMYYQIVDTIRTSIQILREIKALNNQVVLVVRNESDGMPTFDEAFARGKMGA